MDYQQTIDYLYHTLPMFSHMGSAAFKKDLHNTRLLCDHLGNPQTKFKSIHVGGTNGKGSVSHMLASILQSAGYKTGLYTSPHLYDFRERIKINGKLATKEFVVDFVERHQSFIESIQPSFFEITVAMAFEYFAQQKVDVAIIEVGLGGRLDSTNIIMPELSIITNIGWDHMNLLGDTLEAIAFEKAGIIKPGVPVIIGERQPGIDHVFEDMAKEKQAAIYFAPDEYEAQSASWKNNLIDVDVLLKEENKVNTYTIDLPGIYQQKNICTVLKAWELLIYVGFMITGKQFDTGIKNVKAKTGLHGRWEIVHNAPTVVLEVAHNQNGIEEMLKHIGRLQYDHLHLVIGMVKDKEVEKVLQLLPKNASYYFTHAHIPRALDANTLQEKAASFELNGKVFDNVNTAVHTAITSASKHDLIIVCGSIFLVAEVEKKSIIQQA